MGFLKEFGKAIVIAQAQRNGFNDGRAGKPTPLYFCEPFPQDTALAQAYQKGRNEGEKAAVPSALRKLTE